MLRHAGYSLQDAAFGGGPLGPAPVGDHAEVLLTRILVAGTYLTDLVHADRRNGASDGLAPDARAAAGHQGVTVVRPGEDVVNANGSSLDMADIGCAWTRFGKTQVGTGVVKERDLRWPTSAARRASRQELRALLTAQTNGRVALGDWEFGRRSNGEVEVVAPERGWEVSVAYSGQHCAVVAAAGRRLGVDLEAITDPLPDDLPAHLLSAREIELLRAAPEAFWSIWTLKEAFAKEVGCGLSHEPAKLDTAAFACLTPGQVFRRRDGGGAIHGRVRLDGRLYALAFSFGPLLAVQSPSPPR